VLYDANQSNGCSDRPTDIASFSSFKMAAVRHLGFVGGIWIPATMST